MGVFSGLLRTCHKQFSSTVYDGFLLSCTVIRYHPFHALMRKYHKEVDMMVINSLIFHESHVRIAIDFYDIHGHR